MDPFSIGLAIAAFVGTVVVALVALSIKNSSSGSGPDGRYRWPTGT